MTSWLRFVRAQRIPWKLTLTLGAWCSFSTLLVYAPIDWDKVELFIEHWGYFGVFFGVLLGSALVFAPPALSLGIVFAASAYLNPILLGLAAGIAGAIGELTGYLIGKTSPKVAAGNNRYDKWLETYGFWCIAFFAFIPNPLFDAVGCAAGNARYSWKRFFVACLIGKSLKFFGAAWGAWLFSPILHWLASQFALLCEVMTCNFR